MALALMLLPAIVVAQGIDVPIHTAAGPDPAPTLHTPADSEGLPAAKPPRTGASGMGAGGLGTDEAGMDRVESPMTGVPPSAPERAPAATVDSSGEETIRKADRSPDADSVVLDDHPRISPEEYRYAEGPRYTMNGELPYRETYIQTGTIAAFGGALLGLATAITWYQQAWYPDSTKGPFNFQSDWAYSKQFDKAGHMFGGWMSSYCSYEAFIASGLSKEDAAFWGFAGGLFFQTFMEVQDGFHTNYGFDWTDAVSNLIGSGFFYAQQKVPFLQNFDPKWSVGPHYRDSARDAAQIRSRLIVDDYDRQDVWISARVHNLLPEGLKPYWPKWLQLAFGAGARDVELRGYNPYRVAHIALDYNLVEMLPDLGPFGNWLIQGLNHFKLPAPALRIWPTLKFELIYPFRL